MKSTSIIFFGLAGWTMLANSACNSENETKYSATVAWNISGQQTCQAILVGPDLAAPETVTLENIVVTVYEDEDYKTAASFEEVRITQGEADCGDFQLDLQDLERGTYWVTVEAYAERDSDTKAYPYYFGEHTLKVPTADNAPTGVTLAVGRGDVLVQWYFEPKEKCPADGTMKISLDAGTNLNDYNSSEEVACDAEGGVLVTGKSWDSYQLTLEAYDEDNKLTHRGTCVEDDDVETTIEEFELHPGETYECWVKLFAI